MNQSVTEKVLMWITVMLIFCCGVLLSSHDYPLWFGIIKVIKILFFTFVFYCNSNTCWKDFNKAISRLFFSIIYFFFFYNSNVQKFESNFFFFFFLSRRRGIQLVKVKYTMIKWSFYCTVLGHACMVQWLACSCSNLTLVSQCAALSTIRPSLQVHWLMGT